MTFYYLIKLSVASLLRNKGRAFLTMLGIIIGIASVVIIISVGAGAQSLIFNQIKAIGSNLIGILPGQREGNEPPAAALGVAITTLTYDDAIALADPANVPHALASTPYIRGVGVISYKNRVHNTNFTGVSYNYPNVESAKLEMGSFFNLKEEKGLEKVVILGSTVKNELFGKEKYLGESVRINRVNFIVIGAFKTRGTAGFQNQDDQVFIPVTTAQKVMLGIHHVGFIRVKIDKPENVQLSMRSAADTLRRRHKTIREEDDDFFVGSQEMILSVLGGVTNIVRYLLASIAAISLIVGGIGIMNIMFVSVNERTREIGLRKAIGARKGDIMSQFLLEACVITITAGIIGILFGILVSFLIAEIAQHAGYDWDFVVSVKSIVMAFLICGQIGIGFGYYPARKAAELNAIEALRYE